TWLRPSTRCWRSPSGSGCSDERAGIGFDVRRGAPARGAGAQRLGVVPVADLRRLAAGLPARADQATAQHQSFLSVDTAARGEDRALLALLRLRRPAGDLPAGAFLATARARRPARTQRMGALRANAGAADRARWPCSGASSRGPRRGPAI